VIDCILAFRTTPTLKIFDASLIEGDDGQATLTFTVLLNHTYHSDIEVAYHSADFTATEGVDYIAVQDTVDIPAGELSATIDVTIIGDETPEVNEIFYLAASIVPVSNNTSGLVPVLEDGLALGYILDDDFEVMTDPFDNRVDSIGSCGTQVVIEGTPTAGLQVGQWSVLHSSTSPGFFENASSFHTIYTGEIGTLDSLVWTISVNETILHRDTVLITFSPDSDQDGVQDCVDLCLGGDDSKDADGDGSPDECDCNPNDATDSFIIVQNDNATNDGLKDPSYISSNRMIGDATVLSGTDVTFTAGQLITLRAGFEVEAGANFLAQLGPCRNPSGAILAEIPAEERQTIIEEATANALAPSAAQTPKITADLDLSVQPNPATQQALVRLTLPQTTDVVLTLFNQNGQKLKTLLTSQQQTQGEHTFALQVGYLPSGLYFLQARSATQLKTIKLVVQR